MYPRSNCTQTVVNTPNKLLCSHWRTFFKFLLRLALGVLMDLLQVKAFQMLLCNSYLSITGEEIVSYFMNILNDFFFSKKPSYVYIPISNIQDFFWLFEKFAEIRNSKLEVRESICWTAHTGCPVNWYSLSISIPDFSDGPIKKI